MMASSRRADTGSSSSCGSPRVVATVHPSSILRADDADRAREMAAFVKDLRIVKKLMG